MDDGFRCGLAGDWGEKSVIFSLIGAVMFLVIVLTSLFKYGIGRGVKVGESNK